MAYRRTGKSNLDRDGGLITDKVVSHGSPGTRLAEKVRGRRALSSPPPRPTPPRRGRRMPGGRVGVRRGRALARPPGYARQRGRRMPADRPITLEPWVRWTEDPAPMTCEHELLLSTSIHALGVAKRQSDEARALARLHSEQQTRACPACGRPRVPCGHRSGSRPICRRHRGSRHRPGSRDRRRHRSDRPR